VVAMMLPVALWETITGATGISEMIPATRAPLGDTARALIAFAVGALSFAILAVLLLRSGGAPRAATAGSTAFEMSSASNVEALDMAQDREGGPSMIERLKERVAAFIAARRGGSDIADLEDLPKLRSGDAHPDAPPRRPLLATRDLADPAAESEVISQTPETRPVPQPVMPQPAIPEAIAVDSVPVEATVDAAPAAVEAVADLPVTVDSLASLGEMVNRLESALADRDAQLAQLEALVAEGSAANTAPAGDVAATQQQMSQPDRSPRPVVLEAVPSAPSPAPAEEAPDQLDAALRSALETLHRMNARTR
jgi:hypothetical protein